MPPRRPPPLNPSLFVPGPNGGPSPLQASFPPHADPSTVRPVRVVDAQFEGTGNVWEGVKEVGGVVVAGEAQDEKSDSAPNILARTPHLSPSSPTPPPAPLPKAVHVPLDAAAPPSVELVRVLRELVQQGVAVELSVSSWEALERVEELLEGVAEGEKVEGRFLLRALGRPPLSIPADKLLAHPSYSAYISRINALSLHRSLSLSLAGLYPPPADLKDGDAELKRLLKLFLGNALESFGTSRVLFGSGLGANSAPEAYSAWFEFCRQTAAELTDLPGVEQVFGANAKAWYLVD